VLSRWTVASALALVLAVCPAYAQSPATPAPASDLDAFMERVLARRDVNRKVLNDYILDEKEEFEILGPGRFRLHRTSREYTWIVKEDMHVRSPLRYDGVRVPDDERVRYEENWLRREQRRQERKAKGEKEEQGGGEVTIGSGGVTVTNNTVPTEPRFVSEAYFMDFKFEAGNYYLAGREQFEGQEVVKIEYYPTKLFGGKDDEKTPRELKDEPRPGRGDRQREQELEDDIERKMNKTALVTLWVDPKIHQIVRYTFDNVWLDFLPAAWLVRVDSMRASMTMFQPFEGVWLPRGIDISAAVTLANGTFGAAYERRFSDYRQADVKSRIRIPKGGLSPISSAAPKSGPVPDRGDSASDRLSSEEDGRGPWALTDDTAGLASSDQQALKSGPVPVVREVRVHGNVAVPDDEVRRIAGVDIGAPLGTGAVEAITRRLRDSGRFQTVDVRIRLRSLSDPTDAALLLVVHEKPGVIVTSAGEIARPISKRIFSRVMFLPILSYGDGYGFTYGARFSTVGLLGAGERLSVPLTWGGTRRAALEFERAFTRGPLTRILGSTAIWQRKNPRFDVDDRRFELKARAERNVAQIVSLGAEATRADVDFGALDDRLWTVGADAALDTRGNPAFPANAIYLSAGWNALYVRPTGADVTADRINRYTLDGRGYLRLPRQAVLAGRARYTTADAPLPLYERWLIGGSDTLRGFRTGSFDGDKALATSAELRIPITDVTSGGKVGMLVFFDAARIGEHGARLADAEWRRGAGAGVFLIASVIRINLNVANNIDGGGTRVHLSSGFSF
jgi:hypothetical protein